MTEIILNPLPKTLPDFGYSKKYKNRQVWKDKVGASEWNFYCNKHKGKHLGNGGEVYLRPEGWLKDNG